MEYIKLTNLTLHTFNNESRNDLEFVKKLCKDEAIKKWVHGVTGGLLKNPNNEFFGYTFIVKDNEEYVGFIKIGNFNNNENCVYLRAGISADKRKMNYGKMLLSEITEYIFSNYDNVHSIKLKIANDNRASLKTAEACGYSWISDDFYGKSNPYIKTIK